MVGRKGELPFEDAGALQRFRAKKRVVGPTDDDEESDSAPLGSVLGASTTAGPSAGTVYADVDEEFDVDDDSDLLGSGADLLCYHRTYNENGEFAAGGGEHEPSEVAPPAGQASPAPAYEPAVDGPPAGQASLGEEVSGSTSVVAPPMPARPNGANDEPDPGFDTAIIQRVLNAIGGDSGQLEAAIKLNLCELATDWQVRVAAEEHTAGLGERYWQAQRWNRRSRPRVATATGAATKWEVGDGEGKQPYRPTVDSRLRAACIPERSWQRRKEQVHQYAGGRKSAYQME